MQRWPLTEGALSGVLHYMGESTEEAEREEDKAERERVLFIGTEFSILYTSMHSPA